MMKNITKEKLANYVESNSDYYEKYREKFNLKNNFFSWNWSFFFFIPWLAYRKIWNYYIGYLIIAIVYSLTFYQMIVHSERVSPIWMIIVGLGALVFIVYSMLTVNNQVLKRASESNDLITKGKSSWIVVFLASIVLTLPFLYTAKSLYPIFKYHQDRNAIFVFPEKETNMQIVLEKINEISDANVNEVGVLLELGITSRKDLIDIVVCYDNVMLLDRIKEKGALFFDHHLKYAVDCNALNSVSFLLEQGVKGIGKDEKDDFNNFNKYRLVQNAIYKGHLSMAKLLLSKEEHIMGANAQVMIIEAFSIKDSIKKKEFIEQLLSKKIDIYNTLETNETSALAESVANNDYNMTKLLLEHGANPNQHYQYGKTPLSISLSSDKNIQIMKLLLEHKAKVDELESGSSLLKDALYYKNHEKLKLLLNYNATFNIKNFLIGFSSVSTDAISLETLYKYYNIPKLKNKEIVALFQKACDLKSTKAIDILLSKGYDINTTSSDGDYPYVAHVCYGWKDTRMFEYILSKGANVNTYVKTKDNGRNLLQNIISRNSEKVFTKESWRRLKLVLSHGANVNHQDNGNKTALMWADDYPDVIEYLLENTYVDIRLLNDRNESLLHYSDNKPNVMRTIIKKLQKDEHMLDKKDRHGDTPLHNAAIRSQEVVKILLDAGANPDIVNHAGYSPLGYVQDIKSYELLKNTGNNISKSRAKCTVLVGLLGKKEYQLECLKVAKHEKTVNSTSWFQFLGGDIENLLKTDFDLSVKGKRAYIYAYGNVAHGYVLKNELVKAKKNYEEFLNLGWTCNMTLEDADKDMKKDFETMAKIYGEEFKNKAFKIWKELIDEELSHRNK